MTLLPPNATATEQALAAASARIAAIATPAGSLWHPETCPASHLAWLAWALSVDLWNPRWSDARKRRVIAQSMAVHRRKGTVEAVRAALEAAEFSLDISEWFETGDPPHTFRIDVFADDVIQAGGQIDATLRDRIAGYIDTVKPARAHFYLRVGESFRPEATARPGILTRARQAQTLVPQPRRHDPEIAATLRGGMDHRLRDSHALRARPRSADMRPAATVKTGLRLRLVRALTLDIAPREGALYVG